MEGLRQSVAQLFDHFSNGIVNADSPEMAMIEQLLPGQPGEQRHRPRSPPASAARLPRRLQAPRRLHRFLRGHPEAERRTRHRGHRQGGGGRGPYRRRRPPRARRPRPGHRLQGRRLRPPHHRDRTPRPRPRPGVGRPSRGLPLHLGTRTSPTSSCSTGPTGRWGTSRWSRWPSSRSGTSCSWSTASGRVSTTDQRRRRPPWSGSRRRGSRRPNTIWATGCRSWYLDDRGVPAAWPWPFQQFRTEMAEPRWEAYEIRP
jgi:hypothetical protein